MLVLLAKLAGINLGRRREAGGAHFLGWKIGEGDALGLMVELLVGEDMIGCCKEDGRGEEGDGCGAAGGQASLEKRGCWSSTGREAADEDANRDCWLILITLVVDSWLLDVAAHDGGRYAGEELEKQGEADGRKERIFGSGLPRVAVMPQELPAREGGRDNGTGDSNLEDPSEDKLIDYKWRPCSHLLDGAPSLGHRVRVRLVTVSQAFAVILQ